MMKWIEKRRAAIALTVIMAVFLCGCTTLLNGDLSVSYLPEEESVEALPQSGVGAVLNYQDSVFGSHIYESEYPDAFFIPEKYSKEPRDIRGFELLDLVNGDTFIYAYQTMIYQDTGEAPAPAPVDGDYVFYEDSMTEDTRELSGKMVTVLAVNRYTAQTPGEGYRELRNWVTEATDNQSFFAAAVGEWTGGRTAQTGSYAIYFNGDTVVYRAEEMRGALLKGEDPAPLITCDFSGKIREVIDGIMKEEGISQRNRQQYQFDIGDVSFSVGKNYVDVYMLITQSKIMNNSELEKEEQNVDQMLTDSESGAGEEASDEEIKEAQSGMKTYNVRMSLYHLEGNISCTIQNNMYRSQIECFRKNGANVRDSHEWNVSDNSITFLTRQDVLRRCPSNYSGFFLEEDGEARRFAFCEGRNIGDSLYGSFKTGEFIINGRLCMSEQESIRAVRRGYYMEGDHKVESNMSASFIRSRKFILESPWIWACCWNRQEGDTYSQYLVMNGMQVDYAAYIPEENGRRHLKLLDIKRPLESAGYKKWDDFTKWFFNGRSGQVYHSKERLPAIDRIAGEVFHGGAYLFCYTQDGIYLYRIKPKGKTDFEVELQTIIDYGKLNEAAGQEQDQDGASHTESILQEYRETELYRAGTELYQPTVSGGTAQQGYTVNDTVPDVYPAYSINNIEGLWTEDQRWESAWTLCTTSYGLEIMKGDGTPYIPVFQKNVIYEYETEEGKPAGSYYQQLTRLQGVAAYAVFENQGQDKGNYPYLLLGYDYQGTVYTAMDIVRAKVIPFAVVRPGGRGAEEAWSRVTPEAGESRVYYLKDCYDRSLYGTVSTISGYKDE